MSMYSRVFSCVVGRGCLLWPIERHVLLCDTPSVWANYPLACWQLLHCVLMKTWCAESWVNTILLTKFPETFKKSLYWSYNDEKTSYTEGHAERAAGKCSEQLQISSISPYFFFRITADSTFGRENKRTHRKSPWVSENVSKFYCAVYLLWGSHLPPCQLLAKLHSEPISCRKYKRAGLFSSTRKFCFKHWFYPPTLMHLPYNFFQQHHSFTFQPTMKISDVW